MSRKIWEESQTKSTLSTLKEYIANYPNYGDYRLRTRIQIKYEIYVPREAIRRIKASIDTFANDKPTTCGQGFYKADKYSMKKNATT